MHFNWGQTRHVRRVLHPGSTEAAGCGLAREKILLINKGLLYFRYMSENVVCAHENAIKC